jgi:hypothetical protein
MIDAWGAVVNGAESMGRTESVGNALIFTFVRATVFFQ